MVYISFLFSYKQIYSIKCITFASKLNITFSFFLFTISYYSQGALFLLHKVDAS